jgi:hypothetical protein
MDNGQGQHPLPDTVMKSEIYRCVMLRNGLLLHARWQHSKMQPQHCQGVAYLLGCAATIQLLSWYTERYKLQDSFRHA